VVPHLGAFSKLRALDLDFQIALTGAGLDVLLRLPLLEELRLRRFDVADDALAFLPKLPALRSLDLMLNHGVRAEAMKAIGRCRGLRSLTLYGCSQLNVAMLEELTALSQLRELDLTAIGNTWRGFLTGTAQAESNAVALARAKQAEQDGAGVNDQVFGVVGRLPELRVLRLASGRLTGKGLGALSELKHLRELDLGDNPYARIDVGVLPPGLEILGLRFYSSAAMPALTDDDVRALRQRLQNLTTLCLAGCAAITDVAVADLLALPELRELDLARCPKVTSTAIELLEHAQQIQTVRLDDLPWVTLAHAESLFARGITVLCTRPKDAAFEAGLQALAERYRDVARRR
jgi:hypothetical protein